MKNEDSLHKLYFPSWSYLADFSLLPLNLFRLYKFQVRLSEYWSYIWVATSPSNPSALDSIYRRVLRSNRWPQSYTDLYSFYKYIRGSCSNELATITSSSAVLNQTTPITENTCKFPPRIHRLRTNWLFQESMEFTYPADF